MTRSYLLLLTILSLTGCAPDKISTPPVDVTLKPAGIAAHPNFFSPTKVRVYEDVGVNRRWIEERQGVTCQIDSPFYSAKMSTPALVKLPTFGNRTPNFTTTCTYKGETLTVNGGDCAFHRGDPQVSDEKYPRGICKHGNINVIFGK